jgi:23S rRNA G2069 N7-methylase RlmK/C1962 C5-methylase RlmI
LRKLDSLDGLPDSVAARLGKFPGKSGFVTLLLPLRWFPGVAAAPPVALRRSLKQANPKMSELLPQDFFQESENERDRSQANLFARRLHKRARHLRRWPTRRGITCYRIYERDIPEIPLVIDRYEDSLHITEYERPHERTEKHHQRWLGLMSRTASRVLGVAESETFLKSRVDPGKQYEKVAMTNARRIVSEGGLKFLVNLSDYVDTGLFLDHRKTRDMVRREVNGKSFLNLFAYTGSFSVYAGSGGAVSTTTVDWSNTYLDWARENMMLNGYFGSEHEFVRSDATEFLHKCPLRFDVAVVDPPTHSNRSDAADWLVQSGHAGLLGLLATRLNPAAVVYFSTNFRRFRLEETILSRRYDIREISSQTLPEDFRNQRIHRCWRMILR